MMSIFLTFYFVHIFKNASVIFKTLEDEPIDPFEVCVCLRTTVHAG